MSENNDINNPVSDDNPDEPYDSETTQEDVPSFTNIINGLQNMINVVNLQADTNYVNQNINPNAVATTTPDSFNPYVNLDSMTQDDNSVVWRCYGQKWTQSDPRKYGGPTCSVESRFYYSQW